MFPGHGIRQKKERLEMKHGVNFLFDYPDEPNCNHKKTVAEQKRMVYYLRYKK